MSTNGSASSGLAETRAAVRDLFAPEAATRACAVAAVADWPQYLGTADGWCLGGALELAYLMEDDDAIREEILHKLGELSSYELLSEDVVRRVISLPHPETAECRESVDLMAEDLALMRCGDARLSSGMDQEGRPRVTRENDWLVVESARLHGEFSGHSFDVPLTADSQRGTVRITVGDSPLQTAPTALQMRMFVISACRMLGLLVEWDWGSARD